MTFTPVIKNYTLLFLALALVIITIPLENNYNSWAMVAFCVISFFHTPFPTSLQIAWRHKYWILCLLFFFWLCATWFWDSSGGFSIKYMESYSIFLFLPFVMTAMPRLPARVVIGACYLFVATIVVICIICLVKSYIDFRHTGDSRFFFYHYLGYQMGLNAVYLSNYCTTSIAWLLFFHFLYEGQKPIRVTLLVVLPVCAFLLTVVFLLASKMGIFVFLLVMLSLLIYIGYRKKALLKSLLVIIVMGGVVFFLSDNLYYLRWRLSELRLNKYTGSVDDQNGLAVRRLTWESALELWKERPVLGYGLKGAGDALVKKYEEKHFQLGVPERYNSHNQYLETAIRSGAIGLLILLALIAIPLWSAIRQKKTLLLLVILHFMLVCLVETAMEYQQELTFYWFFIFLFYYHYPFPGVEGNRPKPAGDQNMSS
ncbi:O-antigen ligase family protein [Paraflavitalea sp. CAU 1676]|uniref:O-antigen ligase family protein n=1 Tax=Paraflavitalea sp. CAU 1676 TaxID=3032598 RepID=UPI0023D9D8B9|nr:O-antigen ligase family protein [Paraflavitalea sp. CAU 1676]MDF2190805.1 O-antigen ligase family protein [Paraflavitalea sp. CAU 1676]